MLYFCPYLYMCWSSLLADSNISRAQDDVYEAALFVIRDLLWLIMDAYIVYHIRRNEDHISIYLCYFIQFKGVPL